MDVNTPLWADGGLILLQSSGESPAVFWADGGLYIVHEYTAAGSSRTTKNTRPYPLGVAHGMGFGMCK